MPTPIDRMIDSDTLFYIPDTRKQGVIKGVGDSSGIEFINYEDGGYVRVFSDGVGWISKKKLKDLCFAWLALNYPESLKFDDDIGL